MMSDQLSGISGVRAPKFFFHGVGYAPGRQVVGVAVVATVIVVPDPVGGKFLGDVGCVFLPPAVERTDHGGHHLRGASTASLNPEDLEAVILGEFRLKPSKVSFARQVVVGQLMLQAQDTAVLVTLPAWVAERPAENLKGPQVLDAEARNTAQTDFGSRPIAITQEGGRPHDLGRGGQAEGRGGGR